MGLYAYGRSGKDCKGDGVQMNKYEIASNNLDEYIKSKREQYRRGFITYTKAKAYLDCMVDNDLCGVGWANQVFEKICGEMP